MTVEVFVSYSRKNQSLVAPVVAFLERQFVVWWDDDLVGGKDFAEDIFKKIRSTQIALVAWSAHAAESQWVTNESLAAAERCPTIPLLLDATPLPFHLAHLDAIDLRSWDGKTDSHRELRKLVHDIGLHLGSSRVPGGESIASTQVDREYRESQDPSGANPKGLLFYFIAHALCLYFIDWNAPFDNSFVLICFAAANFPLVANAFVSFNRSTSRDILSQTGKRISQGGFAVLWLSILVFLSDLAFGPQLRTVGFFGHETAVHARLDEAKPPRRLDYHDTQCFMLRFANLAAKTPGGSPKELGTGQPPTAAQERVRPLSDDERVAALGCVQSEWQSLSPSTAVPIDIQAPPFIIDYPQGNDWGKDVGALLSAGKYDDVRLLLVTRETKDPAARNLVAVLDAFQLGYRADPKSAFLNFRVAAMRGSKVALANLGICYIFGFGIAMDPIYGSGLVKESSDRGLSPEKAMWLLQNGLSLLQTSDFAELIKALRLQGDSGSSIARAIEGILAAQGLAKEPCAPKCYEIARGIAEGLKAKGQTGLAALIEMNAAARKGYQAVREASQLLPEELRKRAVERYDERARIEAAEARVQSVKEATDPVARAVRKAARR